MIALRALVLACLICTLAACGGGGSNGGGDNGGGVGTNPPPTTPPPTNPPPPEPRPTSEDQSNAQNAQLRMLQIGNQLLMVWVDRFDDELGYQLQRRADNGEWQPMRWLPPLESGIGQSVFSLSQAGAYRLVVVFDEFSLPLHAGANETEMNLELDLSPITVTLDQTEPVRPGVQVTVQNVEPARSVAYSLDDVPVAQSNSGPSFAASLPAERLVNGQHSLLARIQKSEGLFIDRWRPVLIDNPAPALLLSYSLTPSNGSPDIELSAKASSAAGIVSVAFFANDNPVQTVTAPDSSGSYIASLDRTRLLQGENVVRAVATDSAGATVSMDRRIVMDNAPSLEVTGLFDGMIATNGRLDVRATFADDQPGATLSISVGDRRFVTTQTSPLNASYALSDVPAGEYPVVVRVRDATGKVTARLYQLIVPAPGLSYQLIANDASRLLAADQGTLLYQKSSGAVVLRSAAGVETLVPSAAPSLNYEGSEGRFVGHMQTADTFVIESTGTTTNLTASANVRSFLPPNLHGQWASWVPMNPMGRFMLHNLRTGQTTTLTGISTSWLQRHDLIGEPGAERLLFNTTVNGTHGIYSRDLATGATQLLVSGLTYDIQSDGTRLMWQLLGGDTRRLMAAPLDNPSASIELAPSYAQSFLDDGLICWLDYSNGLYVNDGTSTTLLAGGITQIHPHTLKNGRVIYADEGEMHVWTRSGGERAWLSTLATEAIQSDGVAYFLTGTSGTLYRVTLP